MKYLSVFSGMEAATVAWEPLGFEAVGFSEIDPFTCEVLKQRFPNTPNYGDITKHPQWPIPSGAIDILVGGSPCQAFSLAGLRKGLADPRGNLALTFLGLADRLRPEWIVWENVPGVLSSSGGRDFASFIGALSELGYGWAYRVLDAQFFGVAQRRRRVFVIAHRLGDPRVAAEVLALGEGMRGYLEAGGKKRKASPFGAEGCPGSGCKEGRDSDSIPVVIDRAAFNQGENAAYDPKIERSDVMDCLVNRGPHAVGQPICFKIRGGSPVETGEQGGTPGKMAGKGYLGSEDKAFTIVRGQDQWLAHCPEIAPTITSSGPPYSRTGNEYVEADAIVAQNAFPINTMVLGGRPDPANDARMTLGVGNDGDPQFTLQAAHSHAVAHGMIVRRLTPVECERLQGFPDNWSRIAWNGKAEEDCPDGLRYKACGNSMAVPVMSWIGKRIKEYKQKNNG